MVGIDQGFGIVRLIIAIEVHLNAVEFVWNLWEIQANMIVLGHWRGVGRGPPNIDSSKSQTTTSFVPARHECHLDALLRLHWSSTKATLINYKDTNPFLGLMAPKHKSRDEEEVFSETSGTTPEGKGVAECGKETNTRFFSFRGLLDTPPPSTFLTEYVFPILTRGCRDHNPGPGAGWLVGSSGR